MNKEMIELASGLQHSNIPEISNLAKAYLELNTQYESVTSRLIEVISKDVIDKNGKLLKRLADSGD